MKPIEHWVNEWEKERYKVWKSGWRNAHRTDVDWRYLEHMIEETWSLGGLA